MSETITGIEGGMVGIAGVNEFIVSTFSGRVISFSDPEKKNNTSEKEGSSMQQ